MSDVVQPCPWPETWPDWVIVSLREFATAENLLTAWTVDDAPKWVEKMLAEYVRVYFPVAAKDWENDTGPHFLGAMVGHHQWIVSHEERYGNILAKSESQWDKISKAIDAAKLKQGKASYAKWQEYKRKVEADVEQIFEQIDRIAEQKASIVETVMLRMKAAPLAEQSDFNIGLGEAQGTELIDENGALQHGSTVSLVYILMVLYWRAVEKMRSVPALHIYLCRCLGQPLVGDLERVKKICQRNGLSFRRPKSPRRKKGHKR